jgi:N4-gp56 family major capsid protein
MAVGLSADAPNNFVQLFDEPSKGAGDTIKFDLVPNIVGPGVLGDSVIAGHETAWAALQDTFIINQQRQAELLKGRMSQQRVPYSMRDSAKVTLANWWKEIMDVGLLNQLAGNTSQTDVSYTGLQAAIAPDTAHWMYAGTATSEATLTSSMPFDISLIPTAVAKAQTLPFPIKPVVLKGVQVDGIMFLHPYQVKALKTAFSAGGWGDIQKAAMTGGQITGNPIFTGAIGMIDNVVMHQDAHVPYGDNAQNLVYDPVQAAMVAAPTSLGAVATGTTSVARAVFVGAQAAAIGFGGAETVGGKSLKVKWYEELLDAGNQLRVTAGMMYGIKKTRFPSTQDYGVITLSTWASA